MAKAAKMVDVTVAGRVAKMRIVVSEPERESVFTRTGAVVADALRQASDAELETRNRSKYRKALFN